MRKKSSKEVLRDFVKGKIAELLFERMVKKDKTHDYVVIPFGYEYSMPELAKYKKYVECRKTKNILSRSPDFVLISNKGEKPKVYFIEVKYRSNLNKDEILKQAKKICSYWPETYLFLFTPTQIYFEKCFFIKKNNGEIKELSEDVFDKEYQKLTLEVLREFIK